MTRFDWFELGYGMIALQLGYLSTAQYAQYEHYKIYLELTRKGQGHMEAIKNIADFEKCSESTVFKGVSIFINFNS